MAILKDLIVHGSSRFLNKIYANELQTPLINAEAGIFKKLKADDATVVGLLDVKGQLHTNSWSNSNIATIDGSFYITPTIGSDSGTVNITSSSLTFSGTNYAISSLYLGDGSSITWPQYSKVLVTGQVLLNGEWIPLGTLLGQISGVATAVSISIDNIKDNKNQTSNVYTTLVNSGVSSTDYRNLKISLYQRAAGQTDFRPLGIYMTATGTNGRTFLDIYGGVEALENNANHGGFAEPNVRIGNLQGLPNVGGQTPSGWGIYTDNGYFKGIIAADQGYIGSGSRYWVIANYEDDSNSNNSRSYIYSYNGTDSGTNSITSTVEGIYLGTDGIRNYKDSTHNVTIANGVITALGVNLTGQITATSGTIGGWNIGTDTNKSLYYGNQTPGATTTNLVLSPTSTTNSNAIGGSTTGLNWFLSAGKVFGVTTAGALYAASGKIGGWQIGNTALSVGAWGENNSALICTGSGTEKSIGGSDLINNWVFTAGANFGVTKSGALYASSANISGNITATSGTIGGIDIIDGNLNVSSISIGSLNGASNYAQKTDVNAINLSPFFSYSPYEANDYWNYWQNTSAITFTPVGNGWVRVQGSNTGSSTIRKDFYPKPNLEIKEGTDYTWLVEFRNNHSTGTATQTDFYIVQATDCQFWGGNIKENIEGLGSGSSSGLIDYVPIVGTTVNGVVITQNYVYKKRFVKTSEATGSNNWTDGSASNLRGLASFTARCAANTTIDYEVRISVYEGRYLGEYKPYIDSNMTTIINKALNQSAWYAECSTAAGTVAKVATISPATNSFILQPGATVNVKFDVKNTGAVSSITLNVNGTGAKNIKYINNNAISNIPGTDYIAAGCTYQFVYDGTYWVIQNLNYNVNTIGVLGANKLIAGTNSNNASATTVYRYTLIMKKTIGNNPTWVSLVTSSSTGTSKTRYTGGLYPDEVYYMSSNVSSSPYGYSTGAETGTSYRATSIDLRYSTNCGSTLILNKPVYLVGEINSLDGLFYLDPVWWTQTEPIMEDGKTYIYIGRPYSTYQIYLSEKKPIMRFYQGAFRTEEQIAGMTATSYITYIDANNGIQVHNSDDLTDYIQINSDAISIYRGDSQQLGLSMETLRIEDDNIRIGKVGQQNLLLKENGVFIRNNDKDSLIINTNELSYMLQNGQKLFSVKKSVFSQTQTGDGSTKTFTSSSNCYVTDLQQLKINNVVITQGYSTSINNGICTIVFQTAPANNASIVFSFVVNYYITEEIFSSDGTTYEIDKTSIGVLKVYIDDIETSNYTVSQNYQVTLGSDPGEDHIIRISYRAELTGFYTNLGLMEEQEKPQGLYSVVTGIGCSAIGTNSFAGGQHTYVSGECSFGYGYGTSDSDRLEVRGKHSGAIGTNLVVYGNNCGAIGTGLKVAGNDSFAIGSYNSHGSAVAFSVGNGTSNSNRTNAFWVGKTGNVGIAGRLFSSTSALGSDRRALFVRDTVEGSVTVGAGTTNNFSINISKTNYTPWAIYGLYSSSASCNVYRWYMDGNNFVGRVYNPGTSNITVNLTVYVSYIATSAL